MRSSLLHIVLHALILAACRPMPSPAQPSAPTPLSATAAPQTTPLLTAEPVATADRQEVQVTPLATAPLPVDPGARDLVESARADLAAHLGRHPDDIGFVDFTGVVWPDGSLGCPQPDVLYPQVLVEGYLIRLTDGKTTFYYHGGEGRGPFRCENSQPPLGATGLP
jgi:hypothetical protein